LTLPASPGIGLNERRGVSSGTILATGRPYRIIVKATRFFSTSETTLEKCVFASFTFNVVGIAASFPKSVGSLPNIGLLVNSLTPGAADTIEDFGQIGHFRFPVLVCFD
jgi:hypothetical protein